MKAEANESQKEEGRRKAEENCISAAPAALDHYLAALPAVSLIPVAPLRDAESANVRIFSTFICVVS
jgi:hypothetical protein